MTVDELRQGWTACRVGRRITLLSETISTNTVVLDGAVESVGDADADIDGWVVLADYQTGGRGRQGRTWLSPRRASVLASVLLLTGDTATVQLGAAEKSAAVQAGAGEGHACHTASGTRGAAGGSSIGSSSVGGRLTLVAAVAACRAIREATEITPLIKWPNDLLVSERKLGGILIESRNISPDCRAWAVGIGINCLQQVGHFNQELRSTATSLEIEASHSIDRTAVARELLHALDDWLAESAWLDDEVLHRAWQIYAEPLGQRVRLRCEGKDYSGRTVALEPSGGLIVQCDGGSQMWFDPMRTTLL